MSVFTAVSRRAGRRDLLEAAAGEPANEVETLAVLAVRVDADLIGLGRPEQVHRVCHHHRAFMHLVLDAISDLSGAFLRRGDRLYQVIEVH
ncbi:MAG: hypothetical protein ABS75_21230 [Pelagibacterium sp. SCN 63-23]|nr:MAG: hypothetical protein ABS75_21230 [Pelagibacterium sp. SCN 63-23]